MPTEIDLTFPQTYAVEELHEIPGVSPRRMFYLPSGSQTSGRDGILLRICPADDQPWIGLFEFGRLGGTVSVVCGCPDGESLCVVSKGEGYVVRADDPTGCKIIPVLPILGLRVVRAAGLILFWDFTDIAAWGSGDLAWRSRRICSDDLAVEEITSTSIKGSGWCPPKRDRIRFEVDLFTGKIAGRR